MPSASERPLCVVVSAWRVVADADWHETNEPQPEGENTMTTEKLTITLSERGPVSIRDEEWPIIASANAYDDNHDLQARKQRRIIVREHDDGRRLVYGWGISGSQGGYLMPADVTGAETVRAIRRVGGIIEDNDLAWQCIADLPAEEL